VEVHAVHLDHVMGQLAERRGRGLGEGGAGGAEAGQQGAPSTTTWTWPMRGVTASALGPNTGSILRFTARYWMKTMPSLSGPGSGASTMIRAGGCGAVSGATPAGPSTSAALWA